MRRLSLDLLIFSASLAALKAAVFYDQIEIIKSSKELINVRSTHLNVRLECLSILILAVELIFG